MIANSSKLKRPKNPMPGFVREALIEHKLMDDFKRRPAYQQNDYLGWIIRPKKEETKMKRLSQMIHELDIGGIYMNMKHPASTKAEK